MESKKLYFETEKEWLAFKEGKFGASVTGSASGLNKYSTAYDVWERYTNRVPKLESTEAMVWGIYGEDMMRKVFKTYHEVEFLRDLNKILLYQSVEYPYIISTPDDHVIFEGEEMNCEIKTTNFYNTVDEVPEYIIAQCHHQMHLSHHKKTLLIWGNFMNRQHNYMVIEYDKDYAELLMQSLIEFRDLVDNDIPPPPVTLVDYSKTKDNGDVIQADEDMIDVYTNLVSLNEQAKEVKHKADLYKLKLVGLMDEASQVSKEDVKLISYKVQSTRRIDSKRLKEDDLYNEYSNETESRVLRINYKNVDKIF